MSVNTSQMRITLDYARPSPWPSPFMLAALLLAAALLGLGLVQYRQLQDELAALQMRAAPPVTEKSAQRPLSKGAQEQLEQRLREANAVLAELGTGWHGLLDGLEKAAIPEAVLLEIRPEAGKGQLRLAGEARNFPSLLKYVRSLETQAPLTDVVLEEHETMTEDPQKPVSFVIGARWRQTP